MLLWLHYVIETTCVSNNWWWNVCVGSRWWVLKLPCWCQKHVRFSSRSWLFVHGCVLKRATRVLCSHVTLQRLLCKMMPCISSLILSQITSKISVLMVLRYLHSFLHLPFPVCTFHFYSFSDFLSSPSFV